MNFTPLIGVEESWSKLCGRRFSFNFGAQDLMPVHRIEVLVAPGNTASIRLLEKLGFIQEGTRREFGYWKGRYQDVVLYALLKRTESQPYPPIGKQ
jgi:hypothetical protein